MDEKPTANEIVEIINRHTHNILNDTVLVMAMEITHGEEGLFKFDKRRELEYCCFCGHTLPAPPEKTND